MVICPDCGAREAALLCGRFREAMCERPFVNPAGIALPICLCCGVADLFRVGRSPLEIVAAADSALYASKRRGGDTVTLHQQENDFDS